MSMRRSHLLVLTVLVLSTAVLYAQRAGGGAQGEGSRGGGSHGGAFAGGGFHGAGSHRPGHGNRPGFSGRFFPLRSGGHHRGYGGYGAVWLPYGAPYWDDDGYFWDEPSYQQPVGYQQSPPASPQVVVVQDKEPQPPPAPPQPPKLIEVPQSKGASAEKPQPPTLFVLKGGQRLESRNYFLTAQSVQIEVGHQRREIPLDALDLDATTAANHARGIDLTIPRDRTAVFVSF
jgi:hypothetical protein